jgi:hypothetical protein
LTPHGTARRRKKMCSSGRKSRAFVGLVLALAVALLTVTAAQARVDQGILVPPSKEWVQSTLSSDELRQGIKMRRLDARLGGSLVQDDVVVKAGERSWPGVDPTSAQAYPQYHVSPVVVSSTSSFDWGDAAIGAAIALGLVSVLGAGLLATRRVKAHATA